MLDDFMSIQPLICKDPSCGRELDLYTLIVTYYELHGLSAEEADHGALKYIQEWIKMYDERHAYTL